MHTSPWKRSLQQIIVMSGIVVASSGLYIYVILEGCSCIGFSLHFPYHIRSSLLRWKLKFNIIISVLDHSV